MSLENVITLDVDIKKLNYFIEPTVTANDRTVFVINLKDNDFPINLVDVSTITLVSKRLDGRSVITPGVKGLVVGHQVVFELGKSETAVNGRVAATVQLYDYAGRISSIAFGYIVKNDPSASYLLNVGEITLIQIVLEEGPLRIKEATDAAIAANEAVDNIEAKIIETDAVIAETETVKAETLVVKNETVIIKDETLQVKNETLLVKSETEEASEYAIAQGDYAKSEADRLVGTDVSVLDNKLTTFKSETTALLAEKAKQTDLNTTNANVALKSDKSYVDTKIASVVSGAPSGTYATVSALTTAFPTGNTKIYIVSADGKWYYWNGTAWVGGGVYQATAIQSMGITSDEIKNKSVTPTKISFVTIGKNKFNKAMTKADTTINTSGVVFTSVGTSLSDYIDVSPNTQYIATHNRVVCFYDTTLNFISGLTMVGAFTTPSNAVYMRIGVATNTLNVFQVELGTVITPYEGYQIKLSDAIPDATKLEQRSISGTKIKQKSIGVENTSFVKTGKNLFNKSKITKDKIVFEDGSVQDWAGANVTEYISVTPNTQYILSHYARYIGCYRADKTWILTLKPVDPDTLMTTPADCEYVVFAVAPAYLDLFQMELGTTKTRYAPFKMNILENTPIEFDNFKVKQKDFNVFLKDDVLTNNKNDITRFGHAVCHIPTYDNTLSICHPSVVEHATSWNGYKYWMGMTPYPQSPEEPAIVASHDGINWEEPKGIVNPLFTKQDSINLGYSLTSDTHLIFSADKTKLMLYFRSMYGIGEGIHLATSTDGINWTITLNVVFVPKIGETFISIMSPAVELEANNTFSMWSINSNNPNSNVVEKRTSADGIAWSAPTNCFIPDVSGFVGYHLDVKRYNGVYYMLILGNPGGLRLRFLTSVDGVTWTYVKNANIPLSGFEWDKSSHYRSAFLPKANGKFDLWLNGIRNGTTNAWASDAQWRVAYYKDVDLMNSIIKTAPKTSVYYGTVADAPTNTTGYVNGDRYEYTDPIGFIGKVVSNGVWKNFGVIS